MEADDKILAEVGLQLLLERPYPRCQTCNNAAVSTLHPDDLVQVLRHNELAGAIGIVQEVHQGSIRVKSILRGSLHESRHSQDCLRCLRAATNLQKCSGCKVVYFCSRSCQRQGWQAHRSFCGTSAGLNSWVSERATLQELRGHFEDPAARQSASAEELLSAFRRFQHFIDKWTQAGRLPHLVPGHYAIQESLLVAIPIGSLLLWKSASLASDVKVEIYQRLVKMVSMHVRHVQLLVPRFHIAHWTALHYVLGILLAKDLVGTSHNTSTASLASLFESNLDVAKVFDAHAAESYTELKQQLQGNSHSQGSQAFQEITNDPAKLAAFYRIDPELPVEQKMAKMAELLARTELTADKPARQQKVLPAKVQMQPKTLDARAPQAGMAGLDTMD